jgi:hypothetical protein
VSDGERLVCPVHAKSARFAKVLAPLVARKQLQGKLIDVQFKSIFPDLPVRDEPIRTQLWPPSPDLSTTTALRTFG